MLPLRIAAATLLLCWLPCAVAVKVQHSSITIPLGKIDSKTERNFLRQVHAMRKIQASKRVQLSFLQLKEKEVESEIQLHDQVIASKKLATYFGEISIGVNPTSKFKVLFDTGSCEFWVPDETCLSQQCLDHNKYHKSDTFQPRFLANGQPSLMDVEYLSGKLQGYDGYETVHLGDDVSVPHQTVGFATIVNIPLLKDLAWDGIVGLGFKNNEITQRGVAPLMDQIKESKALSSKNLANQFSYFLSKDGGAVTFGGADLSLKRSPQEEFMWVPVDPSNSYWTVKVLGVRKEPQMAHSSRSTPSSLQPDYQDTSFHDGGRDSIIDTGTYLIYAPQETMDNYLSDLHVDSCDDKKSLPNILFQLEGNPNTASSEPSVVELALTPDDYVLEFDEDGRRECLLGIVPDEAEESDQLGGWTFGQVFLRSFYTVFDRDHLQVGFVRTKTNLKNDEILPGLTGGASFRESEVHSHAEQHNGPIM